MPERTTVPSPSSQEWARLPSCAGLQISTTTTSTSAMAAVISTLVLALTMSITATATTAVGPITFIFGDSLTEVGNNNYLQSLARSDFPWYGVDYDGGKPTGRFTNGRTIVDIISAKLGIRTPPPYLSLSPYDDALLKGVNYASGGAGILNETGTYFIEKLSFDDQITCFETTKVAIRAKIGQNATEKLCNEAFFFVGLGSNDYVNNFLQPFLADSGTYTHDEFINLLITTLDGQLRRLYKLGVRKLVFHGLGPLGCIPSQRVKSKDRQCLKGVNQWVSQFNGSVKKLLVLLNSQFPAAQFSFADSYYIVLDLIKHPEAYGFKISNTSCCNVDTGVGGLCLPSSDLCDNRKDYVFWDAFHPTDAANEVIVNRMFSNPRNRQALSPTPAPSPR